MSRWTPSKGQAHLATWPSSGDRYCGSTVALGVADGLAVGMAVVDGLADALADADADALAVLGVAEGVALGEALQAASRPVATSRAVATRGRVLTPSGYVVSPGEPCGGRGRVGTSVRWRGLPFRMERHG